MTMILPGDEKFTAKPQTERASANNPRSISNRDDLGSEIFRAMAIVARINGRAIARMMGEAMLTW